MSMENMGGTSTEKIKNPELPKIEATLLLVVEDLAVHMGVDPDVIYDKLLPAREQFLNENPGSTIQDLIESLKSQFDVQVAPILEMLYNNQFEYDNQSCGWILGGLHELADLNKDYEQIRSEFFGICRNLRELEDPLRTLHETNHLPTYIAIDDTLGLNDETSPRPNYITNEVMEKTMNTVINEIDTILAGIMQGATQDSNGVLTVSPDFEKILANLDANITDIYNRLLTIKVQINSVFDKVEAVEEEKNQGQLKDYDILDALNKEACNYPQAQQLEGQPFFANIPRDPFSISSLLQE